MSCCSINGLDKMFNESNAAKELEKYRSKGPTGPTKEILTFFTQERVMGKTLLDIGGGVGIIQHELIKEGIRNAISVEASPAYNNASQLEANAQGHGNKIDYYMGDFTTYSSQLPSTDVVTLDKVICCYPNGEDLVSKSLILSNEYYGLVYPSDNVFVKLGASLLNFYKKLTKKDYRSYVHSREKIHSLIQSNGFDKIFESRSGFMMIEVYKKQALN
ncbi:MAG: class I SAM-dependent methyltransferase [Candidatus Hodarchaeales archaeon]|jgi:magnesium-protoporphyrin O-methyltransferase